MDICHRLITGGADHTTKGYLGGSGARPIIEGMYQYDQLDQAFVDQRVAEFRDQTRRFLAGELSEDEFKLLRLRNGLDRKSVV